MAYTKTTDFAAKDALLTGNPLKLIKGTEIGAEFDAIEAEFTNVQNAANITLTAVSGTDTITASAPDPFTAYANGQEFSFIAAGTNTGAATLNIDSVGAIDIKKNGGTALSAGDITSGAFIKVKYVSATGDFEMMGGAGEYLEAVVASGSAISLTSGASKTVTYLNLTPGDWEISGTISFAPSSATASGAWAGSVSTVDNTSSDLPERSQHFPYLVTSSVNVSFPLITTRKSLSTSPYTTIYLVAIASFSAGTVSAYGRISARRVR